MEDFCGSPFWDWNLTWYTDSPDFTPCFENTVLSGVPCLFLWVFCLVDVYCSYQEQGALPWSPLNVAKATITSVLACLDVGMLVVYRVILPNSVENYASYPVELYMPAIRATTLILALTLLIYSKEKGVRSSGVQFFFWLLLAITQGVRFRTLVRISTEGEDYPTPGSTVDPVIFILEVVYFPLVLGQLIFHCWADANSSYQEDYEIPKEKKSKASPEYAASFLSRVLFEWYTPMAWLGFRKPLEYDDLWQMNANICSDRVVPQFDAYWPGDLNAGRVPSSDRPSPLKNLNSSKSGGPRIRRGDLAQGGVVTTCAKAYGSTYFCGVILRLIPDLMQFVSPLILRLLIEFVESDEPLWKGIMYAGILFVNAFISTTLAANAIHLFYLTGMSIKSALVSAVYRKALLLSNTERRDRSTGEIVNHIAVDATYFSEFLQSGHLILTSPLLIGIALTFLWSILGVSALAGVVVMVLLIPLNAFVASRIQKLQLEQMEYKDQRTKLMNEILSGIKCIKLYAWEPSFETQVMTIRAKEMEVLRYTAYWNAISNFLWCCSPFLVAISTFGTYVLIDSSHVLDAKTAFVSISLFNVMSVPLTFLPILISNYIQAAVGVKRINSFMNAEEIDVDAISHDPREPNPVVIENGTFCWEEGDRVEATLQDINLQVKDGESVAIVGPVGCGKSSLFAALLNEMEKLGGRVNIRGKIAYVSQQAWIQNASVRDNILFGSPYDSGKYRRVIEACALQPDLDILPVGDKTEIGEKGINLSGGQKQRVSLARAVYSNADVFLLDDPLSAVDAHVGKHIFEKVIGPKGLLRKKTRLLVTHGIVYLPHMDNILVMTNGRISESGTYRDLQEKNGAFAEFLRQHVATESSSDFDDDTKPRAPPSKVGSVVSDSENDLRDSLPLRRCDSKASIASSLKGANKLIEAEFLEKESISKSVYLGYLGAAGWKLTGITLLMYLIFHSFAVGGNLWLSEWTNLPPPNNTGDNPEGQNQNNRNYFYLGIFAGLGACQGLAILGASLMLVLGTVKAAGVLQFDMLTRILRAPVQFFDVTPIGRIVNRFSRDVDSVDNLVPVMLRYLVNSIFNNVAVLVVITITTPIFAAVILPVGFFYLTLQRFFVAISRQVRRLESITRSPIFSHFGETVSGASTIRAYDQQERFIQESERRQDYNMTTYYSMVSSNRWLQVRLETVGNSLVFFAALFAVLGRDTLNTGLVGLSVSYALQMTTGLYLLVRFLSDVESSIVSVERMKEYSHCPQEAPWRVPLWKPAKDWPQTGAIVFDQFKTRYRPGLELVLKNVTCKVRPGEKVGIVGRTGAGKSSVTLGLFRIVEAAGGSIEVDGENISRLGLHDVRGRLTIIPQEPMLFSGSLRLNLDPFEEVEDPALWRALELAHLKKFVEELPGGLSYEVSEGGENLSVGQRQLVCLARALLRKTKILILDEATSAVDMDTEELILKTIRSEFKDCTVLTIAHRLNTIMDSDRVIVLEKGEIMEFDTPQRLLSTPQSLFGGMANEAGISAVSGTTSSSYPEKS